MPRRPRRSRLSAGLTLALLATGMVMVPSLPAAADTPVFVNELHYDNDGTDTGEFVEVAGPAGTDLSGWQLVLYNGNGGTTYDTVTLTGTIPDTGAGFGQVVVDYPTNGIQNGGPDGLALVDPSGSVVQFLGYEGTFAAVGGPADGMTSTDIGVAEGSSTPVGHSLQLTGSGTTADEFTWSGPTTATPGAANEGQAFVGTGDPLPPTVDECPDAIATSEGEATSATVSATDPDSAIADAAITSVPVDGIALDGFTPAAAGGTATATLAVADDVDQGRYDVTVTFSTDDDPAQTVDCTTTVTVGATPIHAIQGSGTASEMDGTPVVVEAVVTSVLLGDEVANQLGGVFVEEESSDRDDDGTTSEGVFVYTGGLSDELDVTTGDVVEITGVVDERFGQTQVDASDGTVEATGTATLPEPAVVAELPTTEGARVDAFEPVEGMRVTLAGPWAVTESYALHQYGELELVPGTEPLQSPTNVLEPGEEAGAIEDAIGDGLLTLLLDDGRDVNLSARTPMLPVPYVSDDGAGTIRRGSTTTDLTAVMGYGFGAYRLQPIDDDDTVEFAYAERPAVPEVGGDTRIATFNVLNYFNGNGDGTGFPTERGAHTPTELERQTDKIVSAMAELDADVLGLMEIENDGDTARPAIDDLVAALNAEMDGQRSYAAVDTGLVGDDAIRVALVYDTRTTVLRDVAVLDDVDPFDRNTRPAVAGRFRDRATGQTFVAVVNHFKSKGSGEGPGNEDAGDGQGRSNADRVKAAQQLLEWIDTDRFFRPSDRVLVLGDLNAYANEDPIDVLRDGGYTDLLDAYATGDREPYTYVYFGAEGRLDHALANDRALDDVTGAAAWHINADEPRSKDYNDDVLTDCTAAEGCYDESTGYGDVNQPELYAPDAFRSSDHDPVLVGLQLQPGRARARR